MPRIKIICSKFTRKLSYKNKQLLKITKKNLLFNNYSKYINYMFYVIY